MQEVAGLELNPRSVPGLAYTQKSEHEDQRARLPPPGWCDVCGSPIRRGLERCAICGEKPYYVLYEEGKKEREEARERNAGVVPSSTMTVLVVLIALLIGTASPAFASPPVPGAPDSGTSVPLSSLDPPFGPSYRVSGPPDPRIIVEWDQEAEVGGNLVAGWIAASGKMGCGFSTSKDDGKTWSQPYYGFGQTGSGGDPVVIPDLATSGVVYALCLYQDGTGTLVAISKSTDGGLTWSNWDRGAHEFWDFPSAVAYGGKIYLIWNSGKPDTNIAVSQDEGMTWGASKYLQDGLSSCIAIDSQQRLHVFSGASIISLQNIRYLSSSDGGATWSSSRDLGFRAGSRPECEVDDARSSIYVATGSSLRQAVYLVRSRDMGSTFDPPITIWNGSSVGVKKIDFVGITVDPRGVVHVGWQDDRNGFLQSWYTNSSDGGTTWLPHILASDNTKPSCAPQCNQAHYGHGLAATPSGAVCYGYISYENYSAEYRSTCNYDGVGGRKLARIEVSPATASITADQTAQFTAQGFDTSGAAMAVKPAWTASGGGIDPSGLFTPDKVGNFEVVARSAGVEGKATVAVSAGALASIAVSPPSATITADATQRFAASGADAKGNPVPVSPAWSTTGGLIDGSGLFTPDAIGRFTVTAQGGTASGSAQVTVSAGALASLHIEPQTATVPADSTLTFTATGKDAKGNDVAVTPAWSFSGTSAEGRIDQLGIFAPAKLGTYRVAAAASGLTTEAQVTVVPGKLGKVSVDPELASLEVGGSVSFSSSTFDSEGNAIEDATVEWSVEGEVGEVSASGLFRATRPGKGAVKVVASKDGVERSALASVAVRDGLLPMLLPFILIGVAVAAVVMGVLAALRRKRKREEEARRRREQWGGWSGQEFTARSRSTGDKWPPPG